MRILTSKGSGDPGFRTLARARWQKPRQVMAAIANVRTLRKVDESKGGTMPESSNLLQRAGVGTPQQSLNVAGVSEFPAFPGAKTRVPSPSPTNSQGVKKP